MRSVPIILVAAHIFSMLGFSTYPALLPELQGEWRISNSEAGIIGSFFFAGYIATVSAWTALTDRIDGRYVYVAGSVLALAGWIEPLWGWRAAFVSCAAGSLISGVMVFASLPANKPAGGTHSILFPLAAWRRILSNRASSGYILGYGVHCLELFGSRAWVVAFLSFSAGVGVAGASPWNATTIAAVVNFAAVPASILGNEMALRVGRRPWILMVMTASSLAGFGGGMLGPTVFGAALDLAGGQSSLFAWACGYAAIGAGCLAAPLVVRLFGARR
ncbi:MAG: MFS transporter [Burkholderiales bacterium]